VSEDTPILITLTDDDMRRIYDRIMSSVPYATPGQLRDDVADPRLCCQSCYDYSHPHAEAWQEMANWLWLSGKDWRTVA
jgi:hypothetical protein